MTDNINYQKASIHFFENNIYIHDDNEENCVHFFLSSNNRLIISTEKGFGKENLSRQLSKEERIQLINFLQQGI